MAAATKPGSPRLKFTAITLVCFAVSLVLFVQIDRCLLHYRAVRLLDDFHSIRLRQTTWPDAQRLMSRWGAYGHYDGTCTATDCTYFITLIDEPSNIHRHVSEYMSARWPTGYSGNTLGSILYKLGSRYAHMRVGFRVKDGIIQRSSIVEIIDAPSSDLSCDVNCNSYGLIVRAIANDHLQSHHSDSWISGEEEQLSKHPYFKVGRPSGCMNCMSADITFTPYISQQQLNRITAFNMSCFATVHVCRTLPQALPAATDWHLYPDQEGGPKVSYYEATRKPCQVPGFALARDVTSVLLVDAISAQTFIEHEGDGANFDRERQRVTARLTTILKGPNTLTLGSHLTIIPFGGLFADPQYRLENLVPNKRYIIFQNEGSIGHEAADPGKLSLDHCSVIEDSPQAEADVQHGLSMNDQAQFPRDAAFLPW